MSLDRMDLPGIAFLYMNPLIALRDSQTLGSANARLLSVIIYKLKQQGLQPPQVEGIESFEPLDKHGLLTLCAYIQMHGVDHRYNNLRREEFRQISKFLREYLYANYKLSPNLPRGKGRPSRVAPDVHNPPTH